MVSPFLSPALFSFTVLAQTETCVASIEAVFSAVAHGLKASADFQVSWLRPILAVNLNGLVARVSNIILNHFHTLVKCAIFFCLSKLFNMFIIITFQTKQKIADYPELWLSHITAVWVCTNI